jgi:hypothetical protein
MCRPNKAKYDLTFSKNLLRVDNTIRKTRPNPHNSERYMTGLAIRSLVTVAQVAKFDTFW